VVNVEERVAFVEGRLVEQSAWFSDLRGAISSLAARVDERCDRLDQRMDRLVERVDRRFDQVDARFLQVDARLERLGADQARNFRWLVGIQVTTLITVVATLLGALAAR
jgi:hypothetical protein